MNDTIRRLALLLSMSSSTLKEIEDKFHAEFRAPADVDDAMALLQALQIESQSISTHLALQAKETTLIALFLMFSVCRSAGVSPATCTAAKAAIHRQLQAIECELREDAKRSEQWKYRNNTKDGRKLTAEDAAGMDAMRFRMILKLFVIGMCSNQVDATQKPLDIFNADQKKVDSDLEALAAAPPASIKEILQDFAQCGDSELALSSIGGVASRAARIDPEADNVPWEYAVGAASQKTQPFPVCPRPPILPVQLGETRILVGPTLSHTVQFDAVQHPKEWRAARELLLVGVRSTLSPAQSEQLIASLSSDNLISVVGITPEIVERLCAANNDTAAAAIILKATAPSGDTFLDAIIASQQLSLSAIGSLLLRVPKALKPRHITAFVQSEAAKIRLIKEDAAANDAKKQLSSIAQQICTSCGQKLEVREENTIAALDEPRSVKSPS